MGRIDHQVMQMKCPSCQSEQVARNGKSRLKDGSQIQKYLCGGCGKQFNERTGTVMARLRTLVEIVTIAMNVRTEGMGIRAAGRVLGKSHSTIIEWERRLASKLDKWSPVAPTGTEITIEGDEVYTRVSENLSPLWVPRMDNTLYWTRKSILGSSNCRAKAKWIIPERNSSSLGMGKTSHIYSVVYGWRTSLQQRVMEIS